MNVVLLHLLCVKLLARTMPEIASRLGAALGWLCGIPVVLYAIHPLRVEMVAWASPQAYLPSITLLLLATLAYLRAHPSSGVFGRSWMIGSSILIVLAVLTKGSAVVLPFVELQRAVKLLPWHSKTHAILGGALVLRGRLDDAVTEYQEALRLDPDHSGARINLGLALARQGRPTQAIAELREAIKRDRQNAEAHRVLAAILATWGRVNEAATEFEEVLRLQPDHAQARAFLARERGRRM